MISAEYARFGPPGYQPQPLSPEAVLQYSKVEHHPEAYGNSMANSGQMTHASHHHSKSMKNSNSQWISKQFKAPQNPLLKHRVLLCEKHITCGSCPYEGKCKYIHDKGVASICKFVNRPCKPDKDHGKFGARDSFFWPNSLPAQAGWTDEYILSPACEPKFYLRHRAVVSMWNHFKHFCHNNNNNTQAVVAADGVDDPFNCTNTFTSTRRLDVFMTLSGGRSLCEDGSINSVRVPTIHGVSTAPMPIPAIVVDENQCISSSPTSVSMLNAAANAVEHQQCVYDKIADRYNTVSVSKSHPLWVKSNMVNAVPPYLNNSSSNLLSNKHYLL